MSPSNTFLSPAYLDGVVLLDAGPVDGARELGVAVVAVDDVDGDVGGRAERGGAVVLRWKGIVCK